MITKKELDADAKEVADQLGVNSPEFMEKHNEIMSDIEKAREGLHVPDKRQTKASPDL